MLLAAGATVVLIEGTVFFVSTDNAVHWQRMAAPCAPRSTLGPAAIDPAGDIFALCLGSLDTGGTTPLQRAALDIRRQGGAWSLGRATTLGEVRGLIALDATHLVADTGGPHVFTHAITFDGGRTWDSQRVPWSGPTPNFVLPWHGPGTPLYVLNMAASLSASADLGETWPACCLVVPGSHRCPG